MHTIIIEKILNELETKKKALSISEISRSTHISRNTAARYLDLMHLSGQVKLLEIGRAKKYLISSHLSTISPCDLSSDLILILDFDFKITYVNEAYLQYSNLSRSQVIGKRIDALNLDLFTSTKILRLLQNYHAEELECHTLEITRENQQFFFSLTLAKVRVASMKSAIAIVIKDITEERKLDEERRFLSAIVTYSDDAIIGIDKTISIITWNSGAEKIFGYTKEEVVGRHISILYPPGEENVRPSLVERIQRGEIIKQYECRRRCKDGSVIHVSLTISLVYDQNEDLMGSSLIVRDITEKKRLIAELRDQHQILQNILNSINEPLFLIEPDMRISHANNATSSRYKIPLNQLIGSNLRDIYSPEIFMRRVDHLQKGWAADIPIHYEDTERDLVVENFLYPLQIEDKTKKWVVLSIDISARKKMELCISELNEQFQRILDSLQVTIAVFDTITHTILMINRYGRDLFMTGVKQKCLFKHIFRCPSEACRICSDLVSRGEPDEKGIRLNLSHRKVQYTAKFRLISWNAKKNAILVIIQEIMDTRS